MIVCAILYEDERKEDEEIDNKKACSLRDRKYTSHFK